MSGDRRAAFELLFEPDNRVSPLDGQLRVAPAPAEPARAIVAIDTAHVSPGSAYHVAHFADAGRPFDGWEITVRDGARVEVFHAWVESRDGVHWIDWHVRHVETGESWGRYGSMGDALMQILDPIAPETDDPAPRRIPRGGR